MIILGQTLFKYVTYDCLLTSRKNEIAIRIATATLVMVRLEMIWRSREISLNIKFNLYNSLIISTLLYVCKTFTLLEESKKRLNTFESK